jgi:hypothetical protein
MRAGYIVIINVHGLGRRIAEMTALEMLEAVGYDPKQKKVIRAAEYLEMWRDESVKQAKVPEKPEGKEIE